MPIISRTSGGEIIAASTFIVDHNSKSKEKSSIVPWSFFFGVQVKNPKPFIRDPSFTNLLDALGLQFLQKFLFFSGISFGFAVLLVIFGQFLRSWRGL
jgi:hypothetical protein